MRVLFLIPKNAPPTLEGNYAKIFKEFVAACLHKDPAERPTAKELLKHKFIKSAGKTRQLMELIDRYRKWKAVAPPDSDGDDEPKKKSEAAPEFDWNFDGAAKTKPKEAEKPREPEKPKEDKTKLDVTKDSKRPSSDRASSTGDKKDKKETGSSDKRSSAAPVPSKAVTPTPGGSGTPSPSTPASNGQQNGARPSALTSVIYPVLSKLLKTHQDEATIAALAQLKIAFDQAEKAQPGITHTMIAQIIETLKR